MDLLNVYLKFKDRALVAKDRLDKLLKDLGERVEKALGKDDNQDPPAFT